VKPLEIKITDVRSRNYNQYIKIPRYKYILITLTNNVSEL